MTVTLQQLKDYSDKITEAHAIASKKFYDVQEHVKLEGTTKPEILLKLYAEERAAWNKVHRMREQFKDYSGVYKAVHGYEPDEKLPNLAKAVINLDPWLSVSDKMPTYYTPVLIYMVGTVRIGELRVDYPDFGDTYQAYSYWDDPYNDGQEWDTLSITHWLPLPNPHTNK